MRLQAIFFLLMTFRALLWAQATPVEAFTADRGVNAGATGVMIVDLRSGDVLAELNPDIPLIPASVTKAVTIAALLRRTGTGYRYVTRLYGEGPVEDGVLKGNLLIAGSGDPSLGATAEPRSADFVEECIAGLKERGIRSVEGIIEVDRSIFPGPGCHPSWAAADRRAYYGAGCFGLNYAQNRSGKSADPDPAATFVGRLRERMGAEGIGISGEASGSQRRILLAQHHSPTIDDIMRSCMMRSDNMYAEALLRTLALTANRPGTTADGAEVSAAMWRKDDLHCGGVNLVDGSGLSRANRMTARFLTEVLVKMASDVDYVSFFPLAGAEGTLRNFMKGTPLDSYIALKTGSMNGIQCYAGYKLDEDYAPTHAVVIMANNMPGSRSALREACASLLLRTFFPDQYKTTDEQSGTDTTPQPDVRDGGVD